MMMVLSPDVRCLLSVVCCMCGATAGRAGLHDGKPPEREKGSRKNQEGREET